MAEERLLGNSFGDLGGTLFSRCFWYTIIPVLTALLGVAESPEGWDVQKNVAPIPRKSTPAAQVVIVSASR